MSALIDADDVRDVYRTTRDDAAIQPFIDVAVALSDARLASQGLTEPVLKEVQRYLAAHLLFITDTGIHESLRTEDVSERFTGGVRGDYGFQSSRWGQMALTLDSSGTLAALGKNNLPAELRLVSRED